MKKTMVLLTVIMATLIGTFGFNFAEQLPMELRVVIDGKKVIFPDEQPFIDSHNRTQVPIRFISEEFGAYVEWKPNELYKEVYINLNGKKISIWINYDTYYINNKLFKMDTKALLIGGRTFVPIRFISEAFGFTVEWKSEINTVYINTKVQVVPVVKDAWGNPVDPNKVYGKYDLIENNDSFKKGYHIIKNYTHITPGTEFPPSNQLDYSVDIPWAERVDIMNARYDYAYEELIKVYGESKKSLFKEIFDYARTKWGSNKTFDPEKFNPKEYIMDGKKVFVSVGAGGVMINIHLKGAA